MKTEISSGSISFAAETVGAEPWILRLNGEGINYIWRPPDDPEKSGGTPLCFPLLGALPDGKYRLNGKEYAMRMHGFAQYHDFAVIEKSENAVLMEIQDTSETLSEFPFAFRFRVLYQVEDRTLKTEFRVTNEDTEEIYFSVGGHPRFSCPIGDDTEGLEFSDYLLEFDRPQCVTKSYGPLETIERFTGEDGRTLRLDYALFEEGAFCYSGIADRTVTLKCAKNDRSLTMKSEGDALLTLWNAPGKPFIAIEPWYGSITSLPVNPEIDGDWKARRGTLRLGPGETYKAVFYITI